MTELVGRLKHGEVERIIVNSLSRFSRSIKDMADLVDVFKDQKCEFVSLTENIDTSTAQGRLFLNILMSIYQAERELAAERTAEIRLSLSEQSKIITRLPYGYKSSKRFIKGRMRVESWTVDESASDNVKRAFRMASGGKTVYEITSSIGLPYATVRYMLSNIAYVGIQSYKKGVYYKADYEPIIDTKTFLKVNPNMQKVVDEIQKISESKEG